MALVESAVTRLAATSPATYRRRVRATAAIYLAIDAASLGVIALVLWRAKVLVTLAQRSNVETLTLLILLALAANYLLTTGEGAIGALRMLRHGLLGPRDPLERERRRHAALADRRAGEEDRAAYLDKEVRLEGAAEGAADAGWTIPLEDGAGSLGRLRLRGVEMRIFAGKRGVSNSLFEYVAHRLEALARRRDPEQSLHVCFWRTIDEDAASAYHAQTSAFRRLEGALGKGPLWPALLVPADDRLSLEEEVRALVPALREEALLPDVEYEAEYSVPVLPEPLAFLQLRRKDNRADPVATMGCGALVMVVALAVLALLIALPPWVPSR